MKNKIQKAVESCAEKAKTTDDSGDAMRFAQAALNLTHALVTIKDL